MSHIFLYHTDHIQVESMFSNGRLLWNLWRSLRYSPSTWNMYLLILFSSYLFYKLFIKLWRIFLNPILPTVYFWGIAHPYSLFAFQYDDSLSLLWLLIYLLFIAAYLWIAWHIPPVLPFSTINNIPMSVNNSNSTSFFF